MKATDLRIGNIVNLDGYYNTIKGGICLMPSEVERYKPIELTEEILLKCGFEKHFELDNVLCLLGFSIEDRSGKFNLFYNGACVVPSIKYLHQLQNLYFALTGEELNIQL